MTATTEQPTNQSTKRPTYELPPPPQLALGTILTLRMQGHSKTNGEEYFAPAIVLNQYDDQYGSIECIIFDSTSGTAYRHSYQLRDLTTGSIITDEGQQTVMKELQSNIGSILFAPDDFNKLLDSHERMVGYMKHIADRVTKLEHAAKPIITNDPPRFSETVPPPPPPKIPVPPPMQPPPPTNKKS